MVVNGVTSATSRDEIALERVLDTRDIPLDRLDADTEVRHMVARVLDSIDGPSRVRVAAFNSAIGP
jgi:FXSXX-COOH protein